MSIYAEHRLTKRENVTHVTWISAVVGETYQIRPFGKFHNFHGQKKTTADEKLKTFLNGGRESEVGA